MSKKFTVHVYVAIENYAGFTLRAHKDYMNELNWTRYMGGIFNSWEHFLDWLLCIGYDGQVIVHIDHTLYGDDERGSEDDDWRNDL